MEKSEREVRRFGEATPLHAHVYRVFEPGGFRVSKCKSAGGCYETILKLSSDLMEVMDPGFRRGD